MRKLTASEVTFTVECEPEHEQIEGNAMASGDDAADEECYQWIRDQVNSGNDWAWCCVKVTAHWNGFHGVDYLGGCSYKSKEDFCNDYYYDDMKIQALDDLNERLVSLGNKIAPLFNEEV